MMRLESIQRLYVAAPGALSAQVLNYFYLSLEAPIVHGAGVAQFERMTRGTLIDVVTLAGITRASLAVAPSHTAPTRIQDPGFPPPSCGEILHLL